jgi:copper transport protein
MLVLAGGLIALMASPASAHAEIVSSSPTPGKVLTGAPSAITLQFSEKVTVTSGGVRVYNTREERVDAGGIEQTGKTVRLPLPKLKLGSYVVTWRVTSADSHPVEGAFTFQIGTAGNATSPAVTGLAQRLLATTKGEQSVGIAYGVIRGLVFAALALLIGGVAFGVIVFEGARASRRLRRLVWGAWGALVGATVVGALVYGPYAAGLGLGDAFKGSVINDTLSNRFGEVSLARLGLLLLAIPVLLALFARGDDDAPRRLPRWWLGAAVPLGVLVAATPGLAGHASTGDWQVVALIADTVHVSSMAVWLGGLVALAFVLLPGRAVKDLTETLPRWSRLALGCVVAIIVTGGFQTWRQVGGLDALRTTDYGRILIVKLVLFSVILVFAAFSREVVLRLFPPPEHFRSRLPVVAGGADDDTPDPVEEPLDEGYELVRLRRSVWAEVAVAILLLGATALLVNAAPAKTAAGSTGGGVVGVTMKSSKVEVDVSLTPGIKGRNDVHVTVLGPTGVPKDVTDLTMTFELGDRKIAPIKVPLRKLSPGHYLSPGFDLPFSGDWRVVAKPVLSEFDQATVAGTLTVG